MRNTTTEAPTQGPHKDDILEDPREFLSIQQVAALLGVTEWTVKNWVSDGHLPSAKIGGTRRIRRSDIDSLFE
jgi:excisionase family DNA binding protein